MNLSGLPPHLSIPQKHVKELFRKRRMLSWMRSLQYNIRKDLKAVLKNQYGFNTGSQSRIINLKQLRLRFDIQLKENVLHVVLNSI